jgi:AMP deaminase
MDLRDKYMEYSAQRLFDNPKDQEDWKIYPEPPQPSWPLPPKEEWEKRRQQEAKRAADPIGSVGNDFNKDNCEIPRKHEVCSRNGIFDFFFLLFFFFPIYASDLYCTVSIPNR